ncbi:MAG: aminopeptidase family protein [Solirubrobacterales bacterium]|jgi:Xaa-Pro aminopeptidase|nr:aminopeptidase family protein [Solirubrobacterales bacterium]
MSSDDRPQRLEERVVARELDLLLITDLVNLRWATGFSGSNGAALIGPGVRTFVTDFRYLTQSAEQVPDFRREISTADLLAGVVGTLNSSPPTPLRIGFDDAHMSVKAHAHLRDLLRDDIELVGAGGLVEELRAVKDAGEVAKIRAAAQLADEALTRVLSRGLAGRTERDVALDLEIEQRRMGAEAVSFPPIVASGAHGALPHAVPRDVVIPEGTLVVIDWGAQLDGYCSDCTRTYATGPLDAHDREVYDIVLEAQLAALAALRPGPTGREIDAVARDIITAAGHGEQFGHGLGHGVGLEVHEAPRLSVTGEAVLVPGMIVTVEPGVYVPDRVGTRIEDLCVVTADGHEVLDGLPKELTTIGA